MSEPKQSDTIIDLLLVDDDEELRDDMTRFFSRRGYNVSDCPDGESALAFADQRAFDVIVLDMMMPGLSGLEVLRTLREKGSEAEVVMLTGQGSIETAVEAMKLGAREYLSKPMSLKDLDVLIRKSVETGEIKKENKQLKEVISRQKSSHPSMIGESPKMQEVYRLIERTGSSTNPILVQGESGTGKELVARGLHEASPLADKPLVVINCGIPTARCCWDGLSSAALAPAGGSQFRTIFPTRRIDGKAKKSSSNPTQGADQR